MNKVFLGGTCAETTWRKELINVLDILYFNPVVADWDEDAQSIEIIEKREFCNIHLYVITSDMIGVFSIAEVVDSAHNKYKNTILHIMPKGFDKAQLRSLQAVVGLVSSLGGIAYIDEDLFRTARVLNYCFKEIE